MMEYYLAIKKTNHCILRIMLTPRSEIEKNINWWLFIWNARKGKLIYSNRKQISNCLTPEWRWESTAQGYKKKSRDDKNVLHLDWNSGSYKMDTFIKTQTTDLEMMPFIVFKF